MKALTLFTILAMIPVINGCAYEAPNSVDYQILEKVEPSNNGKQVGDNPNSENGNEKIKRIETLKNIETADKFVWNPSILWTGPQTNLARFSEDGSKVAFAHHTSGMASDLYIADVETGETRFISHNVVTMFAFDGVLVSKDGSRVLFRRTLDGGAGSWHDLGELWSWEWKTNKSYMVTPNVLRGSLRYVPGGTGVVFVDTQAKRLVLHTFKTKKEVEIDLGIWASPNVDPMQTLPMSENGQWLAYTKGNNKKGDLFLYDRIHKTKTQLSDRVVARTVRFEQGGTIIWTEASDFSGPQRLVAHNFYFDETVKSGAGHYVVWSKDGTKAAYLRSPKASDLVVWDRLKDEETVVDANVQPLAYQFDNKGQQLVYKRVVSATAGKGELMLLDIPNLTVSYLDDVSRLNSAGVWFSADGKMLVHERHACKNSQLRDAVVINLETLEKTDLPNSFTCAVHVIPNGSGFTYNRHYKTPGLVEHAFANQTSILLTNNSTALMTNRSGWAGVFSYQRELHKGWNMHIANWKTGKELLVEEDTKLWVAAVSAKHLVYRTNGTNGALMIAPLP